MLNRCPGSLAGTPTLKIKKCPECGNEVEVFSNEVKVNCEKCGFAVYNDVESCIQYCKYAKYCVGEELYKKLKRKKVAFVGVDNAVRSVMAEALAKEINSSPRLGFVSAGVRPAAAADTGAVEALGAENITWRGRPKDLVRIGAVDVFVLMGPEVELPAEMEKAGIIRWDIPDPRGKDPAEYRRVVNILKEKISRLIREVGENDG
ncbi:MAG: low molecular weight phosphatase family protein [Bacillota bacterium]